jgi:hypothetical protein
MQTSYSALFENQVRTNITVAICMTTHELQDEKNFINKADTAQRV